MDGECNTYDDLDSVLQDGSSEPQNLPLEYLRKITNNFADDRLLGEGGFGKVYKGVLQNGKLVAVKKLDQSKLGVQERQFQNEVYHLMRLKHPNIVRFIGYCYEIRNECIEYNGKFIFAERQQKLICLEYLPNGSLDTHLSGESCGYDWPTRYQIIKGICCGLHYLHEECQCQFGASIIHLDLKPANILLDDNMTPKVADFGLSRLFEDNKTRTCATSLSGSLGYMAPEYLYGLIVTAKADIYNLGVIIIEIITGRKVNPFSFSSPTSYQDFVECVLKSWRSRLEGPASETDCKQIKSSLEIGLGCIKFIREERPTIREIVKRLETWESTNCNANNEEKPPADQVDVTSTRATAGADDNDNDTAGALRSNGLPHRTRARGVFRRQLSRVMRLMTRQLSCILKRPQGRVERIDSRKWMDEKKAAASGRQDKLVAALKDPGEKFTFAQLEAATSGFAPIGAGGFGTLYRGKLSDGREVAIKRAGWGARARWFQSELALHSQLRHRHLVGLVGYCDENEQRLLVYEYMNNGSLYDHLFHPKATTPSSPSPAVSSWKLRIKILPGASRGIEYLHSYAESPIIHGDIKSSNILLDAGWTARVSGLVPSLIWSEGQAHLTEKAAAGTLGYMDPEYYRLHRLTVKSDVYGFGVVMLEVLTGKRAIFEDADGSSPVSVVNYAVPSIVAGELSKVLDPRAPEPAVHEAEAVGLVAYAALHCVWLEGKDRPEMAGIVASLQTALALCEGSSGGGRGLGNGTSDEEEE